MKVISFNILCSGKDEDFWTNRQGRVTDLLKKYKPDVFGLQEAHYDWMKAVTEKMTDYDYIGVGRDDGKKKGEFAPVFYLKDKYEPLSNGTFWLSETPDKPSLGWDGRCIRICSWVILREKETGREFCAMNTHLDHRGEVAQVEGARLIADFTDIFAGLPTFLTGDFNTIPSSPVHEIILKKGFFDTKEIAEETDDSYTFNGFNINEDDASYHSIIDYIFVKNVGKVKSYRVITDKAQGRFVSDHYPVTAEFDF